MASVSQKSRKHTRSVIAWIARYRGASMPVSRAACTDVSLGGTFIQAAEPARVGTLLTLECGAPRSNLPIRGLARVVWVRCEPDAFGPRGMGVQFIKLEPGSAEAISGVVHGLTLAPRELASRIPVQPTLRGMPVVQFPDRVAPTQSAPPELRADSSAERVVSTARSRQHSGLRRLGAVIGVVVLLVMGTVSFAAERKVARKVQAPEVVTGLSVQRGQHPAVDLTAPKTEVCELAPDADCQQTDVPEGPTGPQTGWSLTFQPPGICVEPVGESAFGEGMGDSR